MNDAVSRVYNAVLGPASVVHEIEDDDGLNCDVSEHHDVPASGAVSLVTRGLMHLPLCDDCGSMLRQELLMACWREQFHEDLPTLIAVVGRARAQEGRRLAWGEVLPPAGSLLPNTAMEAMYVSQPGYFDPALAKIDGDGEPVRVRWLIPIHADEASWISERGHEAFEKLLVDRDPDLLDLDRKSVVSS